MTRSDSASVSNGFTKELFPELRSDCLVAHELEPLGEHWSSGDAGGQPAPPDTGRQQLARVLSGDVRFRESILGIKYS